MSARELTAPGLILDTSIVGVAVALVDLARPGAAPVWQAVHETNAGSLQQIATLTAEACAAAGTTPRQLEGVCVATGPGSFTGIKVGLAFSYGLAAGRVPALRMRGDSGLAAAAAALRAGRGAERALALFLPATRTHGFLATIGVDGKEELALVHAEAGSPAGPARAAAEPLEGLDARVFVAGSWPLLAERLVARGHAAPGTLTLGEAAGHALGQLALRAQAAWPDGYAAALPEPRYLRLSTAEEKLAGIPGLG